MSSTWNFRIVRHSNKVGDETVEHYALHEVSYDEAGKPISMTENPVTFVGDTRLEIIGDLIKASQSAQALDVFVPPKEWKED